MTDQPLVSTQWLYDHLDDPDLRVVDIRGHVLPASEPPPHYFAHHEAFAERHIPGAVFVDWTTDITDPASPHGMQIAQPAAYAALMNRLGIGDDTFVVVYDDANNMFAARFWWSLRYYGHERVAVLDGGWRKWTAEDRPVTEAVTTVSPATFTPRPQTHLRRTIDEVAADVRDQSVTLLDVRSTGEYNGDASRAARKGHIPGAVNLPRGQMVDSDGTVPAPEALRARFAQVGITPEAPAVVVYCNAGVSASYGLLALHVAGVKNAAVYDGSWKEWGNDDRRPVE